MKYAVVYSSMTGHSKKIANAAAKALGVEALNLKTSPKIVGAEVLFIVSGIYGGIFQPQLESFLKDLSSENAKNVAFMLSSVTGDYSKLKLREILTANGINVIDDEYKCSGGFLIMKIGHPTKTEIADAEIYAKNIANKF